MQKSDLPFGSEFSPNQIDLPAVLEFAKQHEGDEAGFENTLKEEFFKKNQTSERNKRKLAMNLRLSVKAYGIIDDEIYLTELGNHLYSIRDNTEILYRELAKHILLNLNGLMLVQCVQDMEAAGETIDLVKLRHWLEERGIHFPRGGKHPSMMRLWLEKAGLFSRRWRVNEAKLREIAGIDTGELAQPNAELRLLLHKSLAEIWQNVTNGNVHLRGLAMEALAFKLMQGIGLDYVTTRLRGSDTDGTEVSLLFESTRLAFSRWQVQCRNTASVNLDDIAKEVGLTRYFNSSVIVVISTGQIGSTAKQYANQIMTDTNLAIVMIDQFDMEKIANNSDFFVDVLHREAKHAMKLKKFDLCNYI